MAPGAGALRRLDLYSKVHEDFQVRTRAGGAISFAAMTVITLLLANALLEHLRPNVSSLVRVDEHMEQKVAISLEIDFPRLHCSDVSVDTLDALNDSQIHVVGELHSLPLDRHGVVGRQADRYDAAELRNGSDNDSGGSACDQACPLGGASEEEECCNTCPALLLHLRKMAFAKKVAAKGKREAAQNFDLASSPQCGAELGCRVTGTVHVAKANGNIHVALGQSTSEGGKHVHKFEAKDLALGFDTSHEIRRLRFGEPGSDLTRDPSRFAVPLEGAARTAATSHDANVGGHTPKLMYHYYLSLVRTRSDSDIAVVGDTVNVNSVVGYQYSATAKEKDVQLGDGSMAGLPGVFIVYEFAPFEVQISERLEPLASFMVSVLAIVGAVYNTSGLLDKVVYAWSERKRAA